jgi:hypothetical protein
MRLRVAAMGPPNCGVARAINKVLAQIPEARAHQQKPTGRHNAPGRAQITLNRKIAPPPEHWTAAGSRICTPSPTDPPMSNDDRQGGHGSAQYEASLLGYYPAKHNSGRSAHMFCRIRRRW